MENNTLQKELDVKFTPFGTCFVKIRRDKKNMPFAFIQFTVGRFDKYYFHQPANVIPQTQNDRDATKARNEGAGIMFQGRPCRTEAVRANREFPCLLFLSL